MAKKPSPSAPGSPTYLKGRKPITIPVHDVLSVFKMISDHAQADAFQEAARQAGAFMTLHPKTVNFIKDFVANHAAMKSSAIGQKVINPSQNADRFDCNFG